MNGKNGSIVSVAVGLVSVGCEVLCVTESCYTMRISSALPPENPCASGTCTDHCGIRPPIKTNTLGEIDCLCTSSAARQVSSHPEWNESNSREPWGDTQKCSHPYSVRRSAPRPGALLLEVPFQSMCIPLSGRGLDFCEAVA